MRAFWRWAALGAAVALAIGSPAKAAEPPPKRQAILFLLPGISYEEARGFPKLFELARAGGVALMTTRVALDEERTATAPYVTIGAGAAAGGPSGPVPLRPEEDGASIEVSPFLETAEGAEPGQLGDALARAGLTIGLVAPSRAGARGALVAMDRDGRIPLFRDSLSGASRLLSRADVLVADLGTRSFLASDPTKAALDRARELIGIIISASPAEDLLVLVVAPAPSAEMFAVGDTVTPLIVAQGTPTQVLSLRGRLHGATSETTRQEGVVANVDVAPTILRFLGVGVPEAMVGSEIRAEGEPPDDLHERFLDRHRIRLAVQLVVLGAILAGLIASVASLAAGRRTPSPVRNGVAIFALGAVAAAPLLFPASLLPRLSYAFVLPAIVLGAAGVAAIARLVGTGRAFRPVAVVAAVWVGIVALDGALGFPSRTTALWGSAVLDGGRFFGMTNAAGGILLGGAVLVASRLRPGWGILLLLGAAFFAGLPWIGANLGVAVALFAAFGLWLALALRETSAVGRILIALLTAAGGSVLLVLINALLAPEATHIGVFATSASGPGDFLELAARRAEINLRIMNRVWPAWLVVGTLPIWFWLVFRRSGKIGRTMARDPAWRQGTLVLAAATLVGLAANDTGIAVGGPAFAILLLAILYPAVTERMERWTRS